MSSLRKLDPSSIEYKYQVGETVFYARHNAYDTCPISEASVLFQIKPSDVNRKMVVAGAGYFPSYLIRSPYLGDVLVEECNLHASHEDAAISMILCKEDEIDRLRQQVNELRASFLFGSSKDGDE